MVMDFRPLTTYQLRHTPLMPGSHVPASFGPADEIFVLEQLQILVAHANALWYTSSGSRTIAEKDVEAAATAGKRSAVLAKAYSDSQTLATLDSSKPLESLIKDILNHTVGAATLKARLATYGDLQFTFNSKQVTTRQFIVDCLNYFAYYKSPLKDNNKWLKIASQVATEEADTLMNTAMQSSVYQCLHPLTGHRAIKTLGLRDTTHPTESVVFAKFAESAEIVVSLESSESRTKLLLLSTESKRDLMNQVIDRRKQTLIAAINKVFSDNRGDEAVGMQGFASAGERQARQNEDLSDVINAATQENEFKVTFQTHEYAFKVRMYFCDFSTRAQDGETGSYPINAGEKRGLFQTATDEEIGVKIYDTQGMRSGEARFVYNFTGMDLCIFGTDEEGKSLTKHRDGTTTTNLHAGFLYSDLLGLQYKVKTLTDSGYAVDGTVSATSRVQQPGIAAFMDFVAALKSSTGRVWADYGVLMYEDAGVKKVGSVDEPPSKLVSWTAYASSQPSGGAQNRTVVNFKYLSIDRENEKIALKVEGSEFALGRYDYGLHYSPPFEEIPSGSLYYAQTFMRPIRSATNVHLLGAYGWVVAATTVDISLIRSSVEAERSPVTLDSSTIEGTRDKVVVWVTQEDEADGAYGSAVQNYSSASSDDFVTYCTKITAAKYSDKVLLYSQTAATFVIDAFSLNSQPVSTSTIQQLSEVRDAMKLAFKTGAGGSWSFISRRDATQNVAISRAAYSNAIAHCTTEAIHTARHSAQYDSVADHVAGVTGVSLSLSKKEALNSYVDEARSNAQDTVLQSEAHSTIQFSTTYAANPVKGVYHCMFAKNTKHETTGITTSARVLSLGGASAGFEPSTIANTKWNPDLSRFEDDTEAVQITIAPVVIELEAKFVEYLASMVGLRTLEYDDSDIVAVISADIVVSGNIHENVNIQFNTRTDANTRKYKAVPHPKTGVIEITRAMLETTGSLFVKIDMCFFETAKIGVATADKYNALMTPGTLIEQKSIDITSRPKLTTVSSLRSHLWIEGETEVKVDEKCGKFKDGDYTRADLAALPATTGTAIQNIGTSISAAGLEDRNMGSDRFAYYGTTTSELLGEGESPLRGRVIVPDSNLDMHDYSPFTHSVGTECITKITLEDKTDNVSNFGKLEAWLDGLASSGAHNRITSRTAQDRSFQLRITYAAELTQQLLANSGRKVTGIDSADKGYQRFDNSSGYAGTHTTNFTFVCDLRKIAVNELTDAELSTRTAGMTATEIASLTELVNDTMTLESISSTVADSGSGASQFKGLSVAADESHPIKTGLSYPSALARHVVESLISLDDSGKAYPKVGGVQTTAYGTFLPGDDKRKELDEVITGQVASAMGDVFMFNLANTTYLKNKEVVDGWTALLDEARAGPDQITKDDFTPKYGGDTDWNTINPMQTDTVSKSTLESHLQTKINSANETLAQTPAKSQFDANDAYKSQYKLLKKHELAAMAGSLYLKNATLSIKLDGLQTAHKEGETADGSEDVPTYDGTWTGYQQSGQVNNIFRLVNPHQGLTHNREHSHMVASLASSSVRGHPFVIPGTGSTVTKSVYEAALRAGNSRTTAADAALAFSSYGVSNQIDRSSLCLRDMIARVSYRQHDATISSTNKALDLSNFKLTEESSSYPKNIDYKIIVQPVYETSVISKSVTTGDSAAPINKLFRGETLETADTTLVNVSADAMILNKMVSSARMIEPKEFGASNTLTLAHPNTNADSDLRLVSFHEALEDSEKQSYSDGGSGITLTLNKSHAEAMTESMSKLAGLGSRSDGDGGMFSRVRCRVGFIGQSVMTQLLQPDTPTHDSDQLGQYTPPGSNAKVSYNPPIKMPGVLDYGTTPAITKIEVAQGSGLRLDNTSQNPNFKLLCLFLRNEGDSLSDVVSPTVVTQGQSAKFTLSRTTTKQEVLLQHVSVKMKSVASSTATYKQNRKNSVSSLVLKLKNGSTDATTVKLLKSNLYPKDEDATIPVAGTSAVDLFNFAEKIEMTQGSTVDNKFAAFSLYDLKRTDGNGEAGVSTSITRTVHYKSDRLRSAANGGATFIKDDKHFNLFSTDFTAQFSNDNYDKFRRSERIADASTPHLVASTHAASDTNALTLVDIEKYDEIIDDVGDACVKGWCLPAYVPKSDGSVGELNYETYFGSGQYSSRIDAEKTRSLMTEPYGQLGQNTLKDAFQVKHVNRARTDGGKPIDTDQFGEELILMIARRDIVNLILGYGTFANASKSQYSILEYMKEKLKIENIGRSFLGINQTAEGAKNFGVYDDIDFSALAWTKESGKPKSPVVEQLDKNITKLTYGTVKTTPVAGNLDPTKNETVALSKGWGLNAFLKTGKAGEGSGRSITKYYPTAIGIYGAWKNTTTALTKSTSASLTVGPVAPSMNEIMSMHEVDAKHTLEQTLYSSPETSLGSDTGVWTVTASYLARDDSTAPTAAPEYANDRLEGFKNMTHFREAIAELNSQSAIREKLLEEHASLTSSNVFTAVTDVGIVQTSLSNTQALTRLYDGETDYVADSGDKKITDLRNYFRSLLQGGESPPTLPSDLSLTSTDSNPVGTVLLKDAGQNAINCTDNITLSQVIDFYKNLNATGNFSVALISTLGSASTQQNQLSVVMAGRGTAECKSDGSYGTLTAVDTPQEITARQATWKLAHRMDLAFDPDTTQQAISTEFKFGGTVQEYHRVPATKQVFHVRRRYIRIGGATKTATVQLKHSASKQMAYLGLGTKDTTGSGNSAKAVITGAKSGLIYPSVWMNRLISRIDIAADVSMLVEDVTSANKLDGAVKRVMDCPEYHIATDFSNTSFSGVTYYPGLSCYVQAVLLGYCTAGTAKVLRGADVQQLHQLSVTTVSDNFNTLDDFVKDGINAVVEFGLADGTKGYSRPTLTSKDDFFAIAKDTAKVSTDYKHPLSVSDGGSGLGANDSSLKPFLSLYLPNKSKFGSQNRKRDLDDSGSLRTTSVKVADMDRTWLNGVFLASLRGTDIAGLRSEFLKQDSVKQGTENQRPDLTGLSSTENLETMFRTEVSKKALERLIILPDDASSSFVETAESFAQPSAAKMFKGPDGTPTTSSGSGNQQIGTGFRVFSMTSNKIVHGTDAPVSPPDALLSTHGGTAKTGISSFFKFAVLEMTMSVESEFVVRGLPLKLNAIDSPTGQLTDDAKADILADALAGTESSKYVQLEPYGSTSTGTTTVIAGDTQQELSHPRDIMYYGNDVKSADLNVRVLTQDGLTWATHQAGNSSKKALGVVVRGKSDQLHVETWAGKQLSLWFDANKSGEGTDPQKVTVSDIRNANGSTREKPISDAVVGRFAGYKAEDKLTEDQFFEALRGGIMKKSVVFGDTATEKEILALDSLEDRVNASLGTDSTYYSATTGEEILTDPQFYKHASDSSKVLVLNETSALVQSKLTAAVNHAQKTVLATLGELISLSDTDRDKTISAKYTSHWTTGDVTMDFVDITDKMTSLSSTDPSGKTDGLFDGLSAIDIARLSKNDLGSGSGDLKLYTITNSDNKVVGKINATDVAKNSTVMTVAVTSTEAIAFRSNIDGTPLNDGGAPDQRVPAQPTQLLSSLNNNVGQWLRGDDPKSVFGYKITKPESSYKQATEFMLIDYYRSAQTAGTGATEVTLTPATTSAMLKSDKTFDSEKDMIEIYYFDAAAGDSTSTYTRVLSLDLTVDDENVLPATQREALSSAFEWIDTNVNGGSASRIREDRVHFSQSDWTQIVFGISDATRRKLAGIGSEDQLPSLTMETVKSFIEHARNLVLRNLGGSSLPGLANNHLVKQDHKEVTVLFGSQKALVDGATASDAITANTARLGRITKGMSTLLITEMLRPFFTAQNTEGSNVSLWKPLSVVVETRGTETYTGSARASATKDPPQPTGTMTTVATDGIKRVRKAVVTARNNSTCIQLDRVLDSIESAAISSTDPDPASADHGITIKETSFAIAWMLLSSGVQDQHIDKTSGENLTIVSDTVTKFFSMQEVSALSTSGSGVLNIDLDGSDIKKTSDNTDSNTKPVVGSISTDEGGKQLVTPEIVRTIKKQSSLPRTSIETKTTRATVDLLAAIAFLDSNDDRVYLGRTMPGTIGVQKLGTVSRSHPHSTLWGMSPLERIEGMLQAEDGAYKGLCVDATKGYSERIEGMLVALRHGSILGNDVWIHDGTSARSVRGLYFKKRNAKATAPRMVVSNSQYSALMILSMASLSNGPMAVDLFTTVDGPVINLAEAYGSTQQNLDGTQKKKFTLQNVWAKSTEAPDASKSIKTRVESLTQNLLAPHTRLKDLRRLSGADGLGYGIEIAIAMTKVLLLMKIEIEDALDTTMDNGPATNMHKLYVLLYTALASMKRGTASTVRRVILSILQDKGELEGGDKFDELQLDSSAQTPQTDKKNTDAHQQHNDMSGVASVLLQPNPLTNVKVTAGDSADYIRYSSVVAVDAEETQPSNEKSLIPDPDSTTAHQVLLLTVQRRGKLGIKEHYQTDGQHSLTVGADVAVSVRSTREVDVDADEAVWDKKEVKDMDRPREEAELKQMTADTVNNSDSSLWTKLDSDSINHNYDKPTDATGIVAERIVADYSMSGTELANRSTYSSLETDLDSTLNPTSGSPSVVILTTNEFKLLCPEELVAAGAAFKVVALKLTGELKTSYETAANTLQTAADNASDASSAAGNRLVKTSDSGELANDLVTAGADDYKSNRVAVAAKLLRMLPTLSPGDKNTIKSMSDRLVTLKTNMVAYETKANEAYSQLKNLCQPSGAALTDATIEGLPENSLRVLNLKTIELSQYIHRVHQKMKNDSIEYISLSKRILEVTTAIIDVHYAIGTSIADISAVKAIIGEQTKLNDEIKSNNDNIAISDAYQAEVDAIRSGLLNIADASSFVASTTILFDSTGGLVNHSSSSSGDSSGGSSGGSSS